MLGAVLPFEKFACRDHRPDCWLETREEGISFFPLEILEYFHSR